MKKYVNSQKDAAILSAEFTPMAGGNMAFFTLKDPDSIGIAKRLLHENKQDVIAESKQGDKYILVTRGPRTQVELLGALDKGGQPLIGIEEKKTTEPWVVRSLLGFAGQTLQLASAFMRPARKNPATGMMMTGFANVDKPQFLFAATNLTANGINLVYKGNDLPDPSRTAHVKQLINNTLVRDLKHGEDPLDIRDDRMLARDPDYHKRRALTGAHGFMQKHSVSIGELGLRYVGAFGMAYPLDTAWRVGKLVPHPAPLRHFTGMASMMGKTVALTAKVPDPYNPAGQSWFDKMRETLSFKLGGWIETGAFTALAYDNFFNTGDPAAKAMAEAGKKATVQEAVRSRGIQLKSGAVGRDWVGGLGASLFVSGYIVRHFAKYGSRHVNMQEIYAHAGDTLAKLPPEKVPQALADISAKLAEHFKDDKRVSYGSIYSHLAGDLSRYHQVEAKRADVPDVVVEETPEELAAQPAPHVQAAGAVHTPPATVAEKHRVTV